MIFVRANFTKAIDLTTSKKMLKPKKTVARMVAPVLTQPTKSSGRGKSRGKGLPSKISFQSYDTIITFNASGGKMIPYFVTDAGPRIDAQAGCQFFLESRDPDFT